MDDHALQSLRNLGNEAKEVAGIVDRLRLEVEARNEQVGKQRQQIIALMHEVEALTNQLAARPQHAYTGGSPEHLLQDECRGLSQALAAKPDAMLHAREAAQQAAPNFDTSEQQVVATYTKVGNGRFFNATAAGLALPPGKYNLCIAKDE